MSEKVELKPCPFCGNVPTGLGRCEDKTGEGYDAIECDTCVGSSDAPFCGVHGDDEDAIVASWNSRAAEPTADDWQPIATAPKDGTRILLSGDLVPPCIETGKTVVIAYWTDFNGGGWVWHGAYGSRFTDWSPLPAPAGEGS